MSKAPNPNEKTISAENRPTLERGIHPCRKSEKHRVKREVPFLIFKPSPWVSGIIQTLIIRGCLSVNYCTFMCGLAVARRITHIKWAIVLVWCVEVMLWNPFKGGNDRIRLG